MASAAIPIQMTKKGYVVQSSPPAEYIIQKWGSTKRGGNAGMLVARIVSPICPRCGVSQHSHAAIGCEISVSVAQELADLL